MWRFYYVLGGSCAGGHCRGWQLSLVALVIERIK